MKSSIPLGRVFGISIGAHGSWLIIVALITLSLASWLGQTRPHWSGTLAFAVALVTAGLFFASVVAHELSHSLVARRFGIEVRSITLFLFGGVAQIESEARRPREELLIAIAGPIMSLAVGAGCLGLAALAPTGGVVNAICGWLGRVNLMLGFFNLLPAFPLDGGRVLRGLLWWRSGDLRQATRVAAGAGKVLASAMILFGIYLFFVAGNAVQGMWLAFLGWFLLDAARFSAAQAEMREVLAGVTARDLMSTDCPRLEPGMSVGRFVEEQLLRTGRRCFVVTDGDRVLGLITPRDLQRSDRSRWADTSVQSVMRPLHQLRWVTPDTSALEVMEIMGRDEVNQLPVVEEGIVRGIVSREHLIRVLTTRMELHR